MENISPQNPLSEILKGPDFFFSLSNPIRNLDECDEWY